LLLLKLNNLSHAAIHRLLKINHKAIEDLERRLCDLRKTWVEAKEKEINFGHGKPWGDVEADEATFDKKNLGADAPDPATPTQWEQWCGIVKRGCPKTLVLHRLSPALSAARAPGPGAIRKVEWKPLAEKWLKNKQLVLHTDAAKSYRMKLPGIIHDNVVHCKKRVKVKGVWKWQLPKYVRLVSHCIPGSKKKMTVKAGTQVIDRAWRFLKDRIVLNEHTKVGTARLRAKVRSAQYEYWHRNEDLWLCAGELCTWQMKKIFLPAK